MISIILFSLNSSFSGKGLKCPEPGSLPDGTHCVDG